MSKTYSQMSKQIADEKDCSELEVWTIAFCHYHDIPVDFADATNIGQVHEEFEAYLTAVDQEDYIPDYVLFMIQEYFEEELK